MNFDYGEEMGALREQARRFLSDRGALAEARRMVDGKPPLQDAMWRDLAALGWLGTTVPECYGGAGYGYEALSVIAEEAGRQLLPLPFAATVFLATEALLAGATDAQKRHWLPQIADGSVTATLAVAEGAGQVSEAGIWAAVEAGRLRGAKWPVPEGMQAALVIVAARGADGAVGCFLVQAGDPAVTRAALGSVDPSRPQARLDFDGVAAEPLPGIADWRQVQALLDRVAVLTAFEQVGGAAACLDMAVGYAKQRHAFGRPIGSYQAIKHKLADVFVANELARSNAYYGLMALAAGAADLPVAAATARISAITAFAQAARENIQTHGGMGFTWDADCHLFYRRARQLASSPGSAPYWRDRLIGALERRNAEGRA